MMYSRNRDMNPSSRRGLSGDRAPSYRQPRRMEVPPGYSGHAIVDGEERPLGGEAGAVVSDLPREPIPEPHFDGLPRVSEAGMAVPARRGGERQEPVPAAAVGAREAYDAREVQETPSSEDTENGSGRDTLPVVGHFPFGHGLGIEELFLLGLMWLLWHEAQENGDTGDLRETLLMLGALLLAG